MGIMELTGVSFSIQDFSILKNIHGSIQAGYFYGLLGPNGCGKTTLIRCMTGGLLAPPATIFIDGRDITALSRKALARLVAVVPQNTNVSFSFSLYDIVMMGRSPYIGFFENETKTDQVIVEEAMRATGVWDIRQRDITKVSGGERQRALIARAIAQSTPILVLDEPIASLDLFHQLALMDTCKQLCQQGVTVIAALHDLNIAARYCDACILMAEGSVVSIGNPREIFTPENIQKAYQVDTVILEAPNGAPLVVAR